MHEFEYSQTFQIAENSSITRRFRERSNELETLIRGAHQPSEGEYVEHLVREKIRNSIPDKYKVSTGFIASIEKANENDKIDWRRKVSRQYDIIIWDASNHAPIFQTGDFVVITPSSCIAIIEVTKSLSKDKIYKDLHKFDDLDIFFNTPDRRIAYPLTAIVALRGDKLKTQLNKLEKFYQYESKYAIPVRYQRHRLWEERAPREARGFISGICIIDHGYIRGQSIYDGFNSDSVFRMKYDSYEHSTQDSIEDGFGLFIKDIARRAAYHTRPGYFGGMDVDSHREFAFQPLRQHNHSLWIEDWKCLVPTRNVSSFCMADLSSEENHLPIQYVGIDNTNKNGLMYFNWDKIKTNDVIERFSEKIVGVGKRNQKGRFGIWLFVKEEGEMWINCRLKLENTTIEIDGIKHEYEDSEDLLNILDREIHM